MYWFYLYNINNNSREPSVKTLRSSPDCESYNTFSIYSYYRMVVAASNPVVLNSQKAIIIYINYYFINTKFFYKYYYLFCFVPIFHHHI